MLALRSIANSILTAMDRIAAVHTACGRKKSLEPFHVRTSIMIAILAWLLIPVTAQAATYYIDYSTGANSNVGSKASPWKSAPGMQQGAGCGGATHSYTASPGDQIIFKGGVTWPAACFGMTISVSGTSISTVSGYNQAPVINGAIYFGVDVTWFTGGSFTRPIFDMANTTPTGTSGTVITITGNFVTLDDIEIKRNMQAATKGGSCAQLTNTVYVNASNVVFDRDYFHDWTIGTLANLDSGHDSGSICGNVTGTNQNIYNTEMSDKNTTVTTPAALPYGTCFVRLAGEFAWNNCHDVGEGWISLHGSYHDNQMHDLDGSPVSGYTSPIIHSNGYESDGFPADMYNDLMYNINTDFNRLCQSSKTVVMYNNVAWNSKAAPFEIDDDPNPNGGCPFTTTSSQTWVVNNTAANTGFRVLNRTGSTNGTIHFGNNLMIAGAGTQFNFVPQDQFTNHTVSATEASTYGFNAAGFYSPVSSDPSTVGQGTNKTSVCGTLVALCSDTSGAPWFGGSYKPRGTSWDMGAYMFAGGTTGPPTLSITSPSASPPPISGSVNLQATCTPVNPATCSSVQYSIDGFPFGAAQAVSPYTLSWNTATAANASHIISATATDSNGRPGTAGTVTVTVSNSIPRCFISQDNGNGPLSWGANQSIGAQTANFPFTVTVAPNTANQNSVYALSENPMGAYSDGAALLRANSSGFWDAWNDAATPPNYAAVNSAPYTPGTAYGFSIAVNFTGANAGTYSISETSPSSIVIATNYVFRSTALIASLGYINAISINDTPDTGKVCNAQVGTATSLTFSPTSVNFGSVSIGNTPSQMINVSSAGGATTFTSVVLAGSGDFSKTNTCSGSLTSCSTTVQYAPSTTGPASATLTYTNSASGSPQTVAITATGIPAASSATPSPTSINFGNVQLNLGHPVTSGPVTVALMNVPVTFGTPNVTYDNPDFSTASATCVGSVSAANCLITPEFTPSSLSTETATMTIHDDAPTGGSTQTVALVGTGSNFPTPSPAVQFVLTIPVQHGAPVAVNGVVIGNFNDSFTCQLTCIPKPGANPPWSCTCN